LEPSGPAQERPPQVLKTGHQAHGFFKYAVIRRKPIDLQRIAAMGASAQKFFVAQNNNRSVKPVSAASG
jgi:hypothetical protein